MVTHRRRKGTDVLAAALGGVFLERSEGSPKRDMEMPMGVEAAIVKAVEDALAGARCQVDLGSPGHYALPVVWSGFSGLSRLEQQRSVLSAIAPLMKGSAAPVHAVDRLVTRDR